MSGLNGKSILITGAAMGLAMAEEFAARGSKFSLADYNGKALKEAKKRLRRKYPQAAETQSAKAQPGKKTRPSCGEGKSGCIFIERRL